MICRQRSNLVYWSHSAVFRQRTTLKELELGESAEMSAYLRAVLAVSEMRITF